MSIVADSVSALITLMGKGFKPLLQTKDRGYTHPRIEVVGVGMSATIV